MFRRNLDYAAYALVIVLFVAAVGLHRGRSVGDRSGRQSLKFFVPQHTDQSIATTLSYETFSSLGILHYTFLGVSGNETYQASLWVRYACTADTAKRDVRIVLAINQIPYMFTNPTKSHAVLPPQLGVNGSLPRLYFQTRQGNKRVDIRMQTWDFLLREDWRTATFNGEAELSMSEGYTLHMDGSEHVYEAPAGYCTQPNKLFTRHCVWLGTHEKLYERPAGVVEFVYMEHLKHHLKVGFDGMMWVVRWDTVGRLQQDKQVAALVNQKKVVLVAWEYGVVDDILAYMQVPGYNLLRLAMVGVQQPTLAFWDPDEYLLLPRKRSIKDELYGPDGCLRQVHTPEAEAVIPIAYAEADVALTKQQPDYTLWMARGSVAAAIREMKYQLRETTHCNFGVYCKALIDPAAAFNFHVHQFTRGPPVEANNRVPVGRKCAYMVHFHRMWLHRDIWDVTNIGPPVPLKLQDLPELA